MLLFAVAKTLGSPVSLFGRYPIQMARVYLTRGSRAQWVLCRPPFLTIHSIDFNPERLPDCPSFTATGFLSAPRSSRLLSSYRQPGADRVKAVILERWVRRGKMCTMFVRGRDSEFPVHIIALLRILVLSRRRT